MKKIVMKYVSVLMALWYCLSIIGFDVHSCTRSGERFVTSTLLGISCEEIHPEHSCHSHGSCCGHHDSSCHHEGDEIDCSGCCTNDIHVLAADVLTSSDARHHYGEWNSNHVPCDLHLMSDALLCCHSTPVFLNLSLPDPGLPQPDRQAFLSIWRI